MPASSVERKRGGTRPAVRGYVDTTPQQLPSDKKPFHLLSPRGQWHRMNRAHSRAISDAQNKRVRREAIEAYGARCVCCGETEREFLTIDHSKGAKHEMYGRLYPGLPELAFSSTGDSKNWDSHVEDSDSSAGTATMRSGATGITASSPARTSGRQPVMAWVEPHAPTRRAGHQTEPHRPR